MRCGFAFPHRGRANDMANERRGANENDPAHLSLPNRNRGLKMGFVTVVPPQYVQHQTKSLFKILIL